MKKAVVLAAMAAVAGAAQADTLAQWTYEVSGPTFAALNNVPISGSYVAEGGVNAAISMSRGVHASANTDYSSPSGNGSLESFSSNEWAIGDFYEFTTSTVGYKTITFGWDQTRSATGPSTFDLAISTDGTNFVTVVDNFAALENSTVNGGFWSSTTYVPAYTFSPVGVGALADNQTTVWFRLINQVTPGGTGGTCRVDNVSIDGTLIPAPGALALLGLGACVTVRRRK